MENDLRHAEKQAFRAAVDTGLWDVMIAAVVAMLAIGPLLSVPLGDFWAAAVFVPMWAGLYLLLRVLKQRVVDPRVGVVRFGPVRRARLTRFTVILLVVNVIAFIGGLVAAARPATTWTPPIFLGVIVLIAFSTAAYFLDIPRYFFYGVLLVVAGTLGEVLWRRGLVSHHGYPVLFGASALLIAAIGLLRFAKHLPPRVAGDAAATAGRNHD